MELLLAAGHRVGKGDHIFTIELNGGTAQLEYQTGESGFILVPGSDAITGSGVVVTLKAGLTRAVLTGNAKAWLDEA